MGRAHLKHVVRDRAGNAIQSALVNAYLKGTVTPVSDMFAAETGGSAITTLTSNNQGEVEAWFDTPKFVDLNVTDNTDTAFYPGVSGLLSFASFTETVEVKDPPGEGYLSGVAKASLPAAGIAGRLQRVTDNVRGVWMDQGSQWFSLSGEVVNVKEFGAKGDGVTDDTAAIQAALDSLGITGGTTGGGVMVLPKGIYGISAQLRIAPQVSVLGAGREVCSIKALSTFPIATALIKLGDSTGAVMGSRLENLTINCNNVADSVGVYSERINEQSGLFRVSINNVKKYGMHVKQPASGEPAQTWSMDDVEIYYTTAPSVGAIGVFVDNSSIDAPPRAIRNTTISGLSGTNSIVGIELNGTPGVLLEGIHVEWAITGIVVGNVLTAGTTSIINANTFNVTTLISVNAVSAGSAITLQGLRRLGGTNIIVDSINGNTLTATSIGLYVIGNGAAGAGTYLTDDINTPTKFGNGRLKFGSDVELFRSGPDTLKTDDAFSFGANLVIQSDGATAQILQVGGTNGLKLGGATSQKLGFWNATPIVQPAANADTSGATLAALETEVNELKQLLRNVGLMAS